MAKRHFLSFFVAVMLSFTAFSQTQIWTAQDFIDSVETSGNYKLMADINLGTYDATNNFVIENFSGTFDGNGHTITYQASYNSGSFGLFQSVSGTIKNLTVSASVTFGGSSNHLNVGLLCGTLDQSGTLQSCNVIGVINSTAVSNNGSGTDSGLLVGESSGTIKYCIANGSVAGLGHVGGLIGRMKGGSVLGSAFTGSLYAIAPDKANGDHSYGSVAGGICGAVQMGSSIKSCFVEADIVAEDADNSKIPCLPYGIAYDKTNIEIVNNYCEGTLNGEPIDAHQDVTNSTNTNNNSNYYPGYGSMSNQDIVDALNTAKGDDPNINFGVAGDEVIFGVVSTDKVCETPTILPIANNAGTFTASWTSANDDNTITESHWHWSLTGGDAYDRRGEATSVSVDLGTLPASSTPYTFMVYTDCSETVNGLTSSAASSTFTVDCPAPTGLTASNITDNGFTISWNADVECQVSFNGNEEIILSNQEKTKSFEGLNPETQYTVTVKAKCGNAYVKQASINVTTARLAAPTGLAVNTVWNGIEERGTATITWAVVDGLTYEYEIEKEGEAEPEAGNTVSVFEKTGLSVGAYTLKLRAKKGEKTSEWVSMPYTISSPDAPKNPQVEYTKDGDKYDVTVSWTAGSTPNNGWIVNGGGVQNTASYGLDNQTPGTEMTLSIVEKVGLSTSGALNVPIQVPCLPASEPTSIVPALNSVTFDFADEKTRKIVIGSTVYNVDATSFTIDGLTEGTSYAYEIREYCNTTTNTYSSISSTFSTLACNPVANLSFSNVGQTSATVSWTSQSTNLQYKVVVNEEVPTVQTAKTINLTGLTPATTYTVSVSEQCGEGWGEERTITFPTQGAKTYISAKTGNFSDGATWIGGQIPSIGAGETASITINAGHTVTLDVTFVLRDKITFTNNGVLSIGQAGELINITNNNVGGIVEIVTPIKSINKWTFIGAPFINGYTLGTILPVSGSDISISKYNYLHGEWNSTWEDVESTMDAGEGYFAWPFYGGVVTYTTYGDVCEWDANANNGEGAWVNNGYKPNQQPETALNNSDFQITKTITASPNNGGYWMALANPYPANLSVNKFLSQNSGIQGNCTYRLNGTTWEIKDVTSGNIEITEGFFLNVVSAGEKEINFSKTQLTNYPTQQAKSQVAPREFVELSLVKGNHKSKLYFAHNQEAEQNYDIFDANKLFAIGEIAEPYFVTEGIALVKEEVKELPYYATMNVRSYKDDTVSFVVKSIPKDMSVFIIDNEEEIKMSEDVAYTTHISEGENADRFQVLFKKASVIEDAKDSEITITNTNRLVRVESTQTDLRIEVYNALGQKVFATNDYNFTLNEVSAGTYMIKAYNRITTQTAKIVVE